MEASLQWLWATTVGLDIHAADSMSYSLMGSCMSFMEWLETQPKTLWGTPNSLKTSTSKWTSPATNMYLTHLQLNHYYFDNISYNNNPKIDQASLFPRRKWFNFYSNAKELLLPVMVESLGPEVICMKLWEGQALYPMSTQQYHYTLYNVKYY